MMFLGFKIKRRLMICVFHRVVFKIILYSLFFVLRNTFFAFGFILNFVFFMIVLLLLLVMKFNDDEAWNDQESEEEEEEEEQ